MTKRHRNIFDIDQWEGELDNMGPLASFDALVQHLEAAPDGCPTKQYLADYISSVSDARIMGVNRH